MKRIIAYLLCTFLVFTCIGVSAAQSDTEVELLVSEADADGMVTVSMIIRNSEFQVVNGSFYYNPAAFSLSENDFYGMTVGKPVGADVKKPLLSVVKSEHDAEKGLVSVAVMSNLSYPSPDKYMGERNRVIADENGIEVFSLKLKKLGDGAYDIGFAKKDGEGADSSKSNDVAVACAGEEIGFKTILNLPGAEKIEEIFEPEPIEQPKSEEQLRNERIQDSIILQINNYAAVSDGTLCRIDKDNKVVVPYIKNDRTMIPLRFVAETLGLSVKWVGETSEIVMTGNDIELVMKIGSKTYTKNGEAAQMEASPELTESDRTFVPLRAIAEAFGRSVHWIENQKCVIIVPSDRPWDEKNKTEQRLMQDALLIMSPLIRDLNQ